MKSSSSYFHHLVCVSVGGPLVPGDTSRQAVLQSTSVECDSAVDFGRFKSIFNTTKLFVTDFIEIINCGLYSIISRRVMLFY